MGANEEEGGGWPVATGPPLLVGGRRVLQRDAGQASDGFGLRLIFEAAESRWYLTR